MIAGYVDQERLRQLLYYDAITGLFTWRERPSNVVSIDQVAGCYSSGRILIRIDSRLYQASRLAWLYVHGYWAEEVDHENRKGTDNSLKNLREANSQQNKVNRDVRGDSSSGIKGAYRHHNRFIAKITVNYESIYLGTFATKEEAGAAYLKAAKLYFGEFANG